MKLIERAHGAGALAINLNPGQLCCRSLCGCCVWRLPRPAPALQPQRERGSRPTMHLAFGARDAPDAGDAHAHSHAHDTRRAHTSSTARCCCCCCCSAAASEGRHRPFGLPMRRLRHRPRCGHRARCTCCPPSHPGGRIGRSRRHMRPAHKAHGGGRNDARAAEGRVRRVEMDGGGRSGLSWWSWLWQGPVWQRGCAQEQQQAALERQDSRVRRAAYLRSRPKSPMKDKPAARRPPAGLWTYVQTPRAEGAPK